jgi:hypothetical protein
MNSEIIIVEGIKKHHHENRKKKNYDFERKTIN